jgi:hypothetical protein
MTSFVGHSFFYEWNDLRRRSQEVACSTVDICQRTFQTTHAAANCARAETAGGSASESRCYGDVWRVAIKEQVSAKHLVWPGRLLQTIRDQWNAGVHSRNTAENRYSRPTCVGGTGPVFKYHWKYDSMAVSRVSCTFLTDSLLRVFSSRTAVILPCESALFSCYESINNND